MTLAVGLVIGGLAAYEALSMASAWRSIERVSLDADSDISISGSSFQTQAPTPPTTMPRVWPNPKNSTPSDTRQTEASDRTSTTVPSALSRPPSAPTSLRSPTATSSSTTSIDPPNDALVTTSEGVGTTADDESIPEDAPSTPEVFLLVGSDSRSGIEDLDDFGSFEGERADVIVLAIRDGADVTLLSVPRDLFVEDSCQDGWHRINEAFAGCGDRHGLAVLAGELESLTGLDVDHAVSVDLAGFPSVVDELGGYEICAEHPLRDLKSGLDLDRGCTLAEGETVLQWLRSRYTERYVSGEWETVPGVSDLSRNERQRSFLLDMFEGLADNPGPREVRRTLQSVAPHVTVDDELALRDLATWLWSFREAEIEPESIPVTSKTTAGGAAVLVPTVDVGDFAASLNS
ncbi:MAG TPA: LCP family protein [Acidimicrobiia bacterium]|nr:LCP family protein [Acidimicrobiia bacterium]